MRPLRVPGYNIEVPIEGTDHFLARKPNGTWCLFSSAPKGCGSITVAKTIDELFAEVSHELGMGKGSHLEHRTKQAMSARLFDESYKDLGLKPDDLITLPYPNYGP